MKKYLKINLGFINHDVIVTRSKKAYTKLTKLDVPEGVTGLNYLKDRPNKSKQNIVYIAKEVKDLELFFTGVHEATHVVDDVMGIFGFKDREVRAYLQEWISAFFYFDSVSLIKDNNES